MVNRGPVESKGGAVKEGFLEKGQVIAGEVGRMGTGSNRER